MNSNTAVRAFRWHLWVSALSLAVLTACAAKQAPVAATEPDAEAGPESGLVLESEQIEKLGLVTQPAIAASYTGEVSGYGLVLSHDSVATLTTEVATATAAAHQSRSALTRITQLAGTPGAFPAEMLESAERQAAADNAALSLAQQKLTASLGQHGPWTGTQGGGVLAALATGQTKLVRATFSTGSLGPSTPRRLRLAPFDAGGQPRQLSSTTLWPAPADAAVPGRSFFALLNSNDISEGERLQVWAPGGGTPQTGVLIPAAAAVLNNDAYWFFVEKPAGHFSRQALDISRPLEGGYFTTLGAEVGDAIVVKAAGLLLARELNPSSEAE